MNCPYCNSSISNDNSLLGKLGNVTHYRCRYCGGQFSRTSKKARTLREVGSLCLAPIALAGFVFASEVTTQVNPRTQETTGQGGIAHLLTCDKGWGLGAKASTVGLYALEAHYGFQYEQGPWTVSLLPKGGLSYTDHTVKELPQDIQFSVGAQFLVGYEDFRTGIELWHLSNAGLTQPNIGLNMIAITTGWSF